MESRTKKKHSITAWWSEQKTCKRMAIDHVIHVPAIASWIVSGDLITWKIRIFLWRKKTILYVEKLTLFISLNSSISCNLIRSKSMWASTYAQRICVTGFEIENFHELSILEKPFNIISIQRYKPTGFTVLQKRKKEWESCCCWCLCCVNTIRHLRWYFYACNQLRNTRPIYKIKSKVFQTNTENYIY